jgi:TolB protein
MRTNGEGERLLTENWYQEAPSWSPNGRVLTFYRETPANEAGQGHSSTLWSIDLTGFNERKIDTPQDGSARVGCVKLPKSCICSGIN